MHPLLDSRVCPDQGWHLSLAEWDDTSQLSYRPGLKEELFNLCRVLLQAQAQLQGTGSCVPLGYGLRRHICLTGCINVRKADVLAT